MKKNPISVIALICAVCALAAALFAGVRAGRLQAQIDALAEANDALARQLQAMAVQAETPAPNIEFCTLLIDSWSHDGSSLTITGGFAQVQLENPTTEPDAAISLRHNGTVLQRFGLELVPGEGSGSYEARLTGITFEDAAIDRLTGSDWLELWLEVTVDGQTEALCGAEWHLENGELLLFAG